MAAAQYVEVPGYSALLLRRTFPDLNQPGAILDRSKDWWSGKARWVEDQKAWHFPSGSTIKFGYLEHDKDKYQYQGAEYQFIGFDEATQFAEPMFRYLFSRLRRKSGLRAPLRMRAASNPGGVGHDWVNQRYIVEGEANGRVFVPARLYDNPSLDQGEYMDALDQLDPVTRAQLLEGDWNARGDGASFRRAWFPIVEEVPVFFERVVRAWDTAATGPTQNTTADWTVGVKMARTPEGVFYILDVVRIQGTPADVERTIQNTAKADGPDVEIYMEQEPGASGKYVIETYQFHIVPGYYFQGVRSTGPKTTRAMPMSSMSQAGNIVISRKPWLSAFFDELDAFPYGMHDDQVDAASLAFNQLTLGGELRPASDEIRRLFRYQ